MMFDVIKNNSDNSFYGVKTDLVGIVEKNMGVTIPDDLKNFFSEIGYGFLKTKKSNINRIMGLGSIEDFRLGTGEFLNSKEAETLKMYSDDKLVFFEVNESLYISIGISKNNYGKIFYYNDVIADSLEEFLDHYIEDEEYFLR